ncbi:MULTISPECIES: hypothetical protein [Enterobacter]|uniref:hypothetical protein n=1 Tax=Enterobacteriaceae TaxID=543 RepID=UPI0005EEB196|nr:MULTISPECIES: hypothetical protein [Enterobacter]MDU6330309.1 hypothetical protein [Enterobacter hormaechei]HAV7591646.1 hypothetical protein [Escherichia coli]KJP74026.1 hypothetical protein SR76_09415 [Enterobacter hormaechei subsp. steigerwaltii]UAN30902.1 hypothetical protein KGP22_16995 [Enterobacter sp. JBIWA005]HAV8068548.1 hypothetical protein [Escherichia coli]
MKYKIEVLYKWPNDLKKITSTQHAMDINDFITPMQRRLFVFERNEIYEHTILCPFLSDLKNNTLITVKATDQSNFIIETLDKWPEGKSPLKGFIPQQKYNRLEFGYFCMYGQSSLIPSHLEFNALIEHYHVHKNNNKTRPLIKIVKLTD